jgi:hypothetical protein
MHTFDDILKFKPHCYALRSDGSFCETGLFDCGLLHKIFNYFVFFCTVGPAHIVRRHYS